MCRLRHTSRRVNPHQPCLGTEQGWGWEENGNITMGTLAKAAHTVGVDRISAVF